MLPRALLLLCLVPSAHQIAPTKPAAPDALAKSDHQEKAKKVQQDIADDRAKTICVGCFVEAEPQKQNKDVYVYRPEQDKLYRRYLWGTLVGIGGGLVGFAFLIWQTILLRRSANAAKASADALINIERPWLLISNVSSIQSWVDGQHRQQAYFTVENFGKSPAWITEMGGSFVTLKSISELPPEPVYEHLKREVDRGIVLVQGKEEDIGNLKSANFSFLHKSRSESADWDAVVHKREAIWCVYGYVKYRDIFRMERETRFCYKLIEWPRFRAVDAGANYNQHT